MDTEQASLSHLMISEIPPNFISKFLSNVKNKTSISQINFSSIMKANSQYYVFHLAIPLLAIVDQFYQKLT